jgi:hypothetical protein
VRQYVRQQIKKAEAQGFGVRALEGVEETVRLGNQQ